MSATRSARARARVVGRARAAAAFAAAALLAVLLFGAPGLAGAHGALVSSSPAAGAVLASAPARLRLVFSEPLEPGLARVSLVDGAGHTTRLDAAGDPRDVDALVAPLDSLAAPGAYRVVWRIVSADGHPVSGSFVFRITSAPAPSVAAPPAAGAAPTASASATAVPAASTSAAAPPAPSVADADDAGWGPSALGAPLVAALLRGLAVGALAALVGLLAFTTLPHESRGDRARALLTALAVAAPALLALHLLAWLVNATPDHTLSAAFGGDALSANVGRVEIARTALAVLALWALALARRGRLALAFATAALLASGATGHAAAVHPAWAAPVKAAHLLAVAAWLGGLAWLLTRDATDGGALAAAAGRVSAAALAAVVVVTASGIVETLLFLPSPLDAVRSAYGAVVLGKVAGLAALVLFGAHHRRRVLPRLAEPGVPAAFARSLRRELAVMGAVVLLGGFLAYVPTPAPPAAHAHAAAP